MNHMNQKGFTKIVLILLVVVLAGALGYVMLVKKTIPTEQTQSNNLQNTQPTTPSPSNDTVSQNPPSPTPISPKPKFVFTSPKGGDKWNLGESKNISYEPVSNFQHRFYLEQFSGGKFVTRGEIIDELAVEHAPPSYRPWVRVGYVKVSDESRFFPWVDPGTYYIKVALANGTEIRSDAFQIAGFLDGLKYPIVTDISPLQTTVGSLVAIKGFNFTPIGDTIVLHPRDSSLFPKGVVDLISDPLTSESNGKELKFTLSPQNFGYYTWYYDDQGKTVVERRVINELPLGKYDIYVNSSRKELLQNSNKYLLKIVK